MVAAASSLVRGSRAVRQRGDLRMPTVARATDLETDRPLQKLEKLNVLIIGKGQYVVGDPPTTLEKKKNTSDKGSGVLGPSMFFARKKGLVGEVSIAGTKGKDFKIIRKWVREKVAEGMKLPAEFESYPKGNVIDPKAYLTAIKEKKPHVAVICTPDNTHFEIAKQCIRRGIHVLIVKPIVQKLEQHQELLRLAKIHGVLVQAEYHKEWDQPFERVRKMARQELKNGRKLSDFESEIGQPLTQREAFPWASKGSDINYYLNSHFVQYLLRTMEGYGRPIKVSAEASFGSGRTSDSEAPDTIRVRVQMQQGKVVKGKWVADKGKGCIVEFKASWINQPGGQHTVQKFTLKVGDLDVEEDQARRGLLLTSKGKHSYVNPDFFDTTTDDNGDVDFNDCYGYKSPEAFLENSLAIIRGEKTVDDFYRYGSDTPTVFNTLQTTAVLEAATNSWKHGGRNCRILYSAKDPLQPSRWEPQRNNAGLKRSRRA